MHAEINEISYSIVNEGEMKFAISSTTHWDYRNRADLIESAMRHDAQVVWLYWVSNTLCLTALTSKSKDHITVPQYFPVSRLK